MAVWGCCWEEIPILAVIDRDSFDEKYLQFMGEIPGGNIREGTLPVYPKGVFSVDPRLLLLG